MKILEKIRAVYDVLESHLANNIRVIDISKLTTVTEYFIITDSKNISHLKALLEALEDELEFSPVRIEGSNSESWILLDYNEFVVHLFSKKDRDFYDIERIWSDGIEIDIKTKP